MSSFVVLFKPKEINYTYTLELGSYNYFSNQWVYGWGVFGQDPGGLLYYPISGGNLQPKIFPALQPSLVTTLPILGMGIRQPQVGYVLFSIRVDGFVSPAAFDGWAVELEGYGPLKSAPNSSGPRAKYDPATNQTDFEWNAYTLANDWLPPMSIGLNAHARPIESIGSLVVGTGSSGGNQVWGWSAGYTNMGTISATEADGTSGGVPLFKPDNYPLVTFTSGSNFKLITEVDTGGYWLGNDFPYWAIAIYGADREQTTFWTLNASAHTMNGNRYRTEFNLLQAPPPANPAQQTGNIFGEPGTVVNFVFYKAEYPLVY